MPDLFGDEFDVIKELFGDTAPPDDTSPAEGEQLADIVRGMAADVPIDLPQTAGSGNSDAAPSEAPAQTIIAYEAPAGIVLSAGGPPSEPGGGGGSGGPKDGDGGGPKGGGGGSKTEAVYYYSDNGVEAGMDGANGLAGFDIVIKFDGAGWTEMLMDAFKDAADYLTTIIQNDWDLDGTSEITARREKLVWDDLYLEVSLGEIDGAGDENGNVLASAGPAGFWGSDIGLPAKGTITFDSTDFAADSPYLVLADEIAFHEMMHTLGFGTLWGEPDALLNPYAKSLLDPATGDYTGTAGLEAYNSEFDATVTQIAVEGDGGAGTAGGHWDELEFGTISNSDGVYDGGNELLTGYISDGGFVSYTSIMSLEDLGYDVAYEDYDPSVYTYEPNDLLMA